MSINDAPTPMYRLVNGRTDARAFASFGEIFALARGHPEAYFPIDCSDLSFCNGNLSAALSAVHRQLLPHGKSLAFANLQPKVRAILNDTGLFGEDLKRPRSSVIPLMRFAAGESDRFDLYTRKGLENKGLPRMSAALQQNFFTGIHELFTNFEIHSQSGAAWACGQLFPQMGRIEFSLVDHGVGIPAKIIERGFAPTPHAAIGWAMTGNNTTRELDVPGGLGLKVLRQFISINGGELTVASHQGFWKETSGRVDLRPLPHQFPGTAVTIVFNTKDKRAYKLSNEVKPGEIF